MAGVNNWNNGKRFSRYVPCSVVGAVTCGNFQLGPIKITLRQENGKSMSILVNEAEADLLRDLLAKQAATVRSGK